MPEIPDYVLRRGKKLGVNQLEVNGRLVTGVLLDEVHASLARAQNSLDRAEDSMILFGKGIIESET